MTQVNNDTLPEIRKFPREASVAAFVRRGYGWLMRRETIVAAAILIPVSDELRKEMWLGKRSYPDYLTISAPPPARHGTLMHPLFDYITRRVRPDEQGFLTSKGRYVGRIEALAIVKAAGQRRILHPSLGRTELYSEDLW